VLKTQGGGGVAQESAESFHFGGEFGGPSRVGLCELNDVGVGVAPLSAVEGGCAVFHRCDRRRW